MKAVFYLIFFISIYLFMRNLIKPKATGTRNKVRPKAQDIQVGSEMVHDVYCNTFVPRESAIKETVRGRTYYFCGQECFNKFKAGNLSG